MRENSEHQATNGEGLHCRKQMTDIINYKKERMTSNTQKKNKMWASDIRKVLANFRHKDMKLGQDGQNSLHNLRDQALPKKQNTVKIRDELR